jgi:hypothetical protein
LICGNVEFIISLLKLRIFEVSEYAEFGKCEELG